MAYAQNIQQFQDSYYQTMRLIGLERGIRGSKAQHQDIKDFYRIVEEGRDLEVDELSAVQLKAKAADRDRANQRKQEMEATAKALSLENEQLRRRIEQLEQDNQSIKKLTEWSTDLALDDVGIELGLWRKGNEWVGGSHIINIDGSKFSDLAPGSHFEGNHAIDLVKHVNQCNQTTAIAWIGERFGEVGAKRAAIAHAQKVAADIIQTQPVPQFTPPIEDKKQWQQVEHYLTQKRGIPSDCVQMLHNQGLVYADSKANVVFVMRDLDGNDPDFFLTSEWIKSALINLKLYNCNANKTAILLGSNATVSSDIAPEVPTVIQQLPAIEEISSYLAQVLPDYSRSDIHATANAGLGMYLADIDYGIRQAFASGVSPTPELIASLSVYKIELFKRIYSIQFLQPPSTPIGGLELMQSAFKTYKRLLTTLAKAYNLRLPKGILLIGPPGTGKSYSAKASSAQLGLPLIILEWGNFRSYGNLAEYKLKSLLTLVDRINRVILYLDDFDKGFALDDDLSKRLAGMLLTWMQERTSEVLIIASANNIQWLPPELTRSGRFDEIFKVDLPNYGERHSIFKIHLAKFDARFRNGGDGYSEEEWKRLLKATQRCVGAEIQAIVERAAISTFCQMFGDDVSPLQELPLLEITLSALLAARQSMNPLAIREADRVESMRNIAALHGLPSSSIDSSIYSLGNVDIFGET